MDERAVLKQKGVLYTMHEPTTDFLPIDLQVSSADTAIDEKTAKIDAIRICL